MSELLAPVVIGGIAGAVFVFAGLLWQIKRPWDIFFRMLFIFFGLFFIYGTMGIANFLNDAPLNSGSSPSISCPTATTCYVSYFNSTGDLMFANTTVNGTSWTIGTVAGQDAVPGGAVRLTETNLVNSTILTYVFVAFSIIFVIVEVVLSLKDLAFRKKQAKGK